MKGDPQMRFVRSSQTDQNFYRAPPPIPASASEAAEPQWEVVIEFQLQREREKNRILQQRLRNKQVFIGQMKAIQQNLTIAFEKCQEELDYFRKRNAPAPDTREYLEEINELKHLVIRLEDKITEYEKRQHRLFSLQEKEQKASRAKSQTATRDKRSKTVAQDSSPEFKKSSSIEDYIVRYPNKISSFIERFLGMVECFSNELRGIQKSNVKQRLKIGWKWIKKTVAEWQNAQSDA